MVADNISIRINQYPLHTMRIRNNLGVSESVTRLLRAITLEAETHLLFLRPASYSRTCALLQISSEDIFLFEPNL